MAYNWFTNNTQKSENWKQNIVECSEFAKTYSIKNISEKIELPELPNLWDWHLSTQGISQLAVGQIVTNDAINRLEEAPNLLPYPIRLVALPSSKFEKNQKNMNNASAMIKTESNEAILTNLETLGIAEADFEPINVKYPALTGSSELSRLEAIIQMICLHHNVPYRKDVVRNILNEQISRDKNAFSNY